MPSEHGKERDVAEASAAALYIASLAEELARLAKSHEFEALAYLLDMARLEADQLAKRWTGPAGPRGRRTS